MNSVHWSIITDSSPSAVSAGAARPASPSKSPLRALTGSQVASGSSTSPPNATATRSQTARSVHSDWPSSSAPTVAEPSVFSVRQRPMLQRCWSSTTVSTSSMTSPPSRPPSSQKPGRSPFSQRHARHSTLTVSGRGEFRTCTIQRSSCSSTEPLRQVSPVSTINTPRSETSALNSTTSHSRSNSQPPA